MKLSKLKINPNNPQVFDDLTELENSIKDFPKMMKLRPIIYDPKTFMVLGGNKRLICLKNLKYKEIPDQWVKAADELTEQEKKRFILSDNILHGTFDLDLLEEHFSEFDFEALGLKLDGLQKDIENIKIDTDIDADPEKNSFYTEIMLIRKTMIDNLIQSKDLAYETAAADVENTILTSLQKHEYFTN